MELTKESGNAYVAVLHFGHAVGFFQRSVERRPTEFMRKLRTLKKTNPELWNRTYVLISAVNSIEINSRLFANRQRIQIDYKYPKAVVDFIRSVQDYPVETRTALDILKNMFDADCIVEAMHIALDGHKKE